LDCHDLQWEGLRLGDFDGKTYAIPERRPPRSALPLLSVSILIPLSNIQLLTDVLSFVTSLLRLRIDNHIHWRQFWMDYGNVTPFATCG
jgi:hypothetical protein